MTDSNTYSWSISLAGSQGTSVEKEDIFALDYCTHFPLSYNQTLLRGRCTQKSGIIDNSAIPLLYSLQHLRTNRDHIQALAEQFPSLRQDISIINNLIKALGDAGLLIQAGQLPIFKSHPVEKSSNLASESVIVAIITCDRPNQLDRLIQSLTEYDIEAYDLYVLDDSRNHNNSTKNIDIIRSSILDISYFGRAEQEEYRKRLISTLPSEAESINYLLSNHVNETVPTHGLARNFALLIASGKRLIMIDDDVVCNSYLPNLNHNQWTFSTHSREAEFFTDTTSWNSLVSTDINPLDLHAEYLGRKIDQASVGQNLTLESISGSHVSDLFKLNNSSSIICTMNGSVGDPGTRSNSWIFSLDSDSLIRLNSDDEHVKSAFQNRNCWLGRRSPTLSNRYTLLSQITGIDHRHMCPPYVPTGRNEDFLFGTLLQIIHPDKLSADLPIATPHLPIPARAWTSPHFTEPRKSDANLFLGNFLQQKLHESEELRTAHDRLQKISMVFDELSNFTSEALKNSFITSLINLRISSIAVITTPFNKTGNFCPTYKEYLQKFTSINYNNLNIRNFDQTCLPANVAESFTFQQFQKDCALFSAALTAWPEIVNCAKTINQHHQENKC